LIPDIEQFLLVAIFKMATTISQKFNIVGQCWIFAILWRPFWKWRSVEIFQCRESIQDIITYPLIKFWWYRTMLIFSLNNFYWSPFSKWPPQYRKNSTLSDIITIRYVGR
jgi:hypothetical protein